MGEYAVQSDKKEDGLDLLGMTAAHLIVESAYRNGLTITELRRLAEDDVMQRVIPIIRDEPPVESAPDPNRIIIDCDADPFIPDSWSVEEHRKGGQLEWNCENVELWLSQEQQSSSIQGHQLRKQMAEKRVFNANVLDHLLTNPHIIPEEWKSQYIFFWGTIYRNRNGRLYVRSLYWDGGAWCWNDGWLGRRWRGGPALVPARN
ncbi:MAG: hypothetical protein CMI52_02750 [Parcubacteria group bacterium]|nr:hypothetical protein [Parcubacteria group bacterium]|tara:strand:- start:1932 stop:2543 length:612 start_codon:yes stop_codon:yes gene_type:complete